MSTDLLQAPAMETVSARTPRENLAMATEKLAALRFFVLLTARREALESVDPEACELVRSDLIWLRGQYFDMVDAIAMHYGVQQAMDAKQEVERGVTVPHVWPPAVVADRERAEF